MRSMITLATVCLITLSAVAQVVTVLWGPNAEYRNLFERVSQSAFVVKGTVVAIKHVMRRGHEQLYKEGPNGSRIVSVEETSGGGLFTVEPSEVLCRQQDFIPGASQTAVPPNPVHLYVPPPAVLMGRSSEVYPGMGVAPELLVEGKQYLLFLYRYPRQDELVSRYELDPKLTYYRAFEGQLGAFELRDAGQPGFPRDLPLVDFGRHGPLRGGETAGRSRKAFAAPGFAEPGHFPLARQRGPGNSRPGGIPGDRVPARGPAPVAPYSSTL